LEEEMAKEFASEHPTMLEAQAESKRLGAHQKQSAYQGKLRWLMLAGILILLVLATCYHFLIYLPQPDVPHRFTLLDDVFAFGVVGLVGLVGLILGRRLLRLFPLAAFSRLERSALALGLGWGLVSLSVLAVGLAHVLYTWVLMLGLGLVLVIFWRDTWNILAALTSAAFYRRLRAFAPSGVFLTVLAICVLIELGLAETQSLTLPYIWPRGFDLYEYHWAVPELFLLHHAIYALPGWAHANFPFNSEMLNTLALSVGSPIAALFLQASFLFLALLLLAAFLYRRFGLLAAWLGIGLAICNPPLYALLISGYAELAVAYYGVATVTVVLAWLEQEERPGSMRLLALAGLFAGLGLGAKYTGGQVIAGVLLLLVGMCIIRIVGTLRRRAAIVPVLRRFSCGLVAYSAAILLAFLPWLLKDWFLLGNPIYPFIWGGPEWDAARTETGVVTLAHFGPQGGSLWQRVLTGYFSLFTDTGHVDDPPYVPFNILLMLVVLAPLCWLVERMIWQRSRSAGFQAEANDKWALRWLIVAGGGYLAWILSGAAVGRYGFPWQLLLTMPCAAILTHVCQANWRAPFARVLAWMLRALAPAVILFTALVALVATSPFWFNTKPLSLVTGAISLHQWEEQHMMDKGYWAMVDYVEQNVPRDARLLLVGRGTGYFLQGFDYVADSGDDEIPYLETEGRTPAGIVRLLQQDHFRYLIYEERTLTFVIQTYQNHYLAGFLPAFREFLASSLKQLWTYDNFHVYQIPSTQRRS
jgi:hypothetical protein